MAGQSLGSDYTQLDYGNDPGNKGLVIRRFMRRNGQAFNYAYDLLGRVTTVTPPSLTWQDVPIGYAYDNLGQVTQVTDTVYGHNAGYAYDALGRVVSESGKRPVWPALRVR